MLFRKKDICTGFQALTVHTVLSDGPCLLHNERSGTGEEMDFYHAPHEQTGQVNA